MKALIWKEWRENVKWVPVPALLILLPVVGLVGLQSILGWGLSSYVSLVAGLFAVGLGFVQVYPDAHGDRRALLRQRPLSRTQSFLAKSSAGLGLYLLAVGIPVAVLVGLAATPGHVAKPFQPAMALALVADVLAGVVYYFAGMLTAQREARWYGSKCLGLAAGLFCSILVWTLPEFWQAVLAVGVVGGFAAVAAWGSFCAGGAYAPQPRLAKVALAVSFLFGLSTVSFQANYFGGRWLEPHDNYSYRLDRRGRVLVVHSGEGELRVTDLQGRTAPGLEGVTQEDYHALEEVAAPFRLGARARTRSYRSWNRFHIEHRNESRLANEDWWYAPDLGRLLGYDRQTKRFIGSFGPDGFAAPGAPAGERFTGLPYHASRFPMASTPEYLAFAGGVYRVDFRKRTVRTLFTPAAGETVLWADRWKLEKQNTSLAFVGTDRAVHVLDEAGMRLATAPAGPGLENYQVGMFGLLEGPRRYWVWYEPRWYVGLEALETLPAYVVEYDEHGSEVARQAVPPRPGGARATGPREPGNEPSFTPALSGLVTPPMEVAVLVSTTRYFMSEVRDNQGTEAAPLLGFLLFTTQFFLPGVRWHAGAHPGLVSGFAVLITLTALASALVCLLLARRHAFSRPRCVGWALLGLSFGWVGLALMLALEEWPARVGCPKCRKPRVVTRDACEHCGAPHAAPAADGTEVFEPDGTTLSSHVALSAGQAPAGR
jgi:hypothetical protein